MDEGPEEQETFASLQTDVQLLQQAWVNETAAPELLHYDAELVAALQDELMRQGDRAASVGDAAESTARVLPGQTRSTSRDNGNEVLASSLYLMEMDRVSFVLKAYLRTRLAKIHKYGMHLLTDGEYAERMSPLEAEYCRKYVDMVGTHFESAFLSTVPEQFRSLTKSDDGEDMIAKPDLDRFVFVQVKDDIGHYEVEENETAELTRGDIYILRYKAVKNLLVEDRIRLL